MNKHEQDEQQEARKKTGCDLGEIIFTHKDGSDFIGFQTIRLHCAGGEGPYLILEVEKIDSKGIKTKVSFALGESELRALEQACSIGRRWCEHGYAPGIC